jgi:hypothetical protein
MMVVLFNSLIVVLSVCQDREQASYCHASDIELSRRRLRRSFQPGDRISTRMFRHKNRIQHVPGASATGLSAGKQHPISIAAPAS